MIRATHYETVSKFVKVTPIEYCGLFFSGHGVHVYTVSLQLQ